MSREITTVTFLRYEGFKSKHWALKMMRYAQKDLNQTPGLRFYKLMGSGKGLGFNPFPDWSVYCLLQVWENELQAVQFFEKSRLFEDYKSHTSEQWILYLKVISVAGSWSNKCPFHPSDFLDPDNPLIAIITRATIKIRKLPHFWSYVPTSHRRLKENEGLIYTKGIGEFPIIQMGTFSLWKDLEAVKKFAYQSKEHQQAIKKTRALNWYKEELFSRFQPFKSVGRWEGKDLLPPYLFSK